MDVSEFRFNGKSKNVTRENKCFRPPCFPPPTDWPLTIDRVGNSLSYYHSSKWDYRFMGGPIFNFGAHGLGERNEEELKKITFCFLYDPSIFPRSLNSVEKYFYTFLTVAKACENQGIAMGELHRFPTLFPVIAKTLASVRHQDRISHLHKWRFYSLSKNLKVGGEKFIVEAVKHEKNRTVVQNPYIPNRIISYQANRLHSVLEKFHRNRKSFESAYNWVVNAWRHNKSVADGSYSSPFTEPHLYKAQRIVMEGGVVEFLKEFGIYEIVSDVTEIENEESNSNRLSTFSSYLTLLRDCSIVYIMNFSLQRMSEATSLRADCFSIEKDKRLGNLCTITGETTKTAEDSDARWVVPNNVQIAVEVAAFIARLRMKAVSDEIRIPKVFIENPFLFTPALDLWMPPFSTLKNGSGSASDRFLNFMELYKMKLDYSNITRRKNRVLDPEKIRVTEEEARTAIAMTPNIEEKPWFGVGKPWKFSTHQIRRTVAVNMFISEEVSLGSLQDALKHYTRDMTLYYLKNYANVRLDHKVSKTLIHEYYASVGRKLINVIDDDLRFIRPNGRSPELNRLIELVDVTDESALKKMIQKGDCGVRETLVGVCVRTGECAYGGIESLIKCTGADGKGICADAAFDTKNKTKLEKLKFGNDERLADLSDDSPMYTKLKLENYAIRIYLDAILQK